MPNRFARGGGRGAVRAPRRQIANDILNGQVDGLSVTTTLVKGTGDFGIILGTAAATLVRTRGVVRVAQQTNSGVSVVITGAWALKIVSSDAFNAGVASLPGPLSDDGTDFFAYGAIVLTQFGATASITDPGVFQHFEVDSRGMRKMKSGDTIVLVVELIADVSSTTVVDLGYSFRFQTKL